MQPRANQPDPGTRAKQIAMRLLGVRAWSRAELLTRLTRRGCDEASALAAVDDLERQGLTGDERYADERVRNELAKKPAGDVLLRHTLTSRGIDGALADKAAQKHTQGQSESARAAQLVTMSVRQAGLVKNPFAERRRLSSLLARRGFDAEVAQAAIEDILGPPPEPESVSGRSDDESTRHSGFGNASE